MSKRRRLDSVAVRLVGSLLLGALVIAVVWATLDSRRQAATLRLDVTGQVVSATRELQDVLRSGESQSDENVERVLRLFVNGQPVRAVRLSRPYRAPVIVGAWDAASTDTHARWVLDEHATPRVHDLSLGRMTLIEAPFQSGRDRHVIEIVVDGPAMAARGAATPRARLVKDGVLIAALMLATLLMVRRWVALPLAELVELVRIGARPALFDELARRQRGEFRELASALGQTLRALEESGEELAERQRAMQDLFDLAPAAMVALSPEGRIDDANRAAVELLAGGDATVLLGRDATELLQAEDQPMLAQMIRHLAIQDRLACQWRLTRGVGAANAEVSVEAVAVRDELGDLSAIRLALTDVSSLRQIQRRLQGKTRLLDLLVEHMSDAVLLTAPDGRVLVANERATTLLRPAGRLVGEPLNPATVGDRLGMHDPARFARWCERIAGCHGAPQRQRFEVRGGASLFHAIPVGDGLEADAGVLWVIRDVSQNEQGERLAAQRKKQLAALRDIGAALIGVRSVDELLVRVSEHLRRVLAVDAVGLAVRDASGGRGRRARQMIQRTGASFLLEPNKRVVEAVEQELLPHILAHAQPLCWPDLDTATTPWARAFTGTGLTGMAAAPIRGSSEAQGIVWIARRGGEAIEPHQIDLLETLCPLLAARLDMAALTQRLQNLHLVDHATDLPSHLQFEQAMYKLIGRPGQPSGMMVIEIDRFDALVNDLGQRGGDRVLRTLATRLLGACRRSGFVARFAGPSFGVIASGVDATQMQGLAERLRQAATSEPIELGDGSSCEVTCSVGAACFPSDAVRPDELLDLALVRLAAAQRVGRNRIVCSGPGHSRLAG